MLRTPAPFIGAVGVCQKRALALLAQRASEFWKTFCSLFSRFLKGRRRDRAVITACVFALLSGLTRALLVSLKRALAELARHACEFPKITCSLFSRVLEGRVLVCAEVRACVLALPSGSVTTVLVPVQWSFRDLNLLWPAFCSVLTKGRSLSFLRLESPGFGGGVIRACVFALPSGSTRA